MNLETLQDDDRSALRNAEAMFQELLKEGPLNLRQRLHSKKFTRSPKPRFLYRYLSPEKPERIKQIIVDNKLYFSSAEFFNDPFECLHTVRPVHGKKFRDYLYGLFKEFQTQTPKKERIRLVDETLKRYKYNQGKFFEDNRKNFLNESRICCLNSDPRSILMWSHYAQSHKGVVLQFKVAGPSALFSLALPIHYRTVDDRLPVFEVEKQIDGTYGDEILKALFLSKLDDWSYEREHRIMLPRTNSNFIPFDPIHLTGVILGCNAHPDTEDDVRKFIDASSSKPSLYKARQVKGEYKLKILKKKLRPCNS